MAVDQPRRDPGAARVVLLARLVAPFGARPDPGNQIVSYSDYAILDRAVRRAFAASSRGWRSGRPRRASRYDSGMKKYFAREALLPQGWARGRRRSRWTRATIVEVAANSKGGEKLAGPALPGMANLHSHAFQRAMAGLTEMRGPGEDDFWTWRELMYRFVERVTPQQAKAIATQLYVEMLMHGYTAIAEFHYVHHPAGMLDEPSRSRPRHRHRHHALAFALHLVGLRRASRCSRGRSALPRARKQIVSVARIRLRPDVSADFNLGVAPHSLRAVDPQALKELVAAVPADAPVHIHAAEQTKEVDECKAALGKRPVEWLLSEMPHRSALVRGARHAHDRRRNRERSRRAARWRACAPRPKAISATASSRLPSTAPPAGRYGIGGDSHVSRDPAEELRLARVFPARERAQAKRRGVAATAPRSEPRCGSKRQPAARRRSDGAWARSRRGCVRTWWCWIENVDLTGRSGDAIANAFIFSGARSLVRDVMVAGRWVVKEGRHAKARAAASAYKRALKALLA